MDKLKRVLKKFRIQASVAAVALIIIGLMFIIFRDTSLTVICYVAGALLMLWGVLCLVTFFAMMILGGDNQEFGLRGGTENVASIVGFGKACELVMQNQTLAEQERLEDMKSVFFGSLDIQLGKYGLGRVWALNGCSRTATKTVSLRVNGVDAESLILLADNAGVCISAGSACNSRLNAPSHVLTSIGLTPDQARSSFRVSFSRMNTVEEVAKAAEIIADCIATLLTINSYGEG